MRLERALRRRRPISLTPLIDIIFLLLLFFMLSSTFTRFAELPLMTSASGGTVTDVAPVFVQLGAETLSVNGTPTDIAGLPDALEGLRDDTAATQPLLVTLGREVTSQRLIDLLAALRGVPGFAINVLE